MARWLSAVMVSLVLLSGSVLAQQQAMTAKSPGGDRIATAENKTVQVTDTKTGKVLMKIAGFKADISTLIYAPDGKLLAVADKDGGVSMIDAATGKMVWKSKALVGVNVLSFSADGKKITARAPGGSQTFEMATGKKVK